MPSETETQWTVSILNEYSNWGHLDPARAFGDHRGMDCADKINGKKQAVSAGANG